jgi:hypothetical protein
MSWTDPVTDWESFSSWLEYTVGNLFNQRVSLYYRMRDGGARFDSKAELEAGLRHADWVFAEPIEQYLAEVYADPSKWPDPKKYPPGALSLLQYRMNTGGDWLGTHEVEGRKVILYPERAGTEILRWLCGPFWEEQGRRLAAESLMLDHEHNQSFYREMLGRPPRGKELKRRRRSSRLVMIDAERRTQRSTSEPDSWVALADWLEAEVVVFHGLPRVYDMLRHDGHSFAENEAVNATVRDIDQEEDEVLRPILVNFAQRGTWPKEAIHPDFAALLGVRIETVARWARTHVLPGGCIVEYPKIPFRRFLRWLLFHWWDRPGRYFAADEIMLEMLAELQG